jgi:hypothetical protein
MSAERRYSSFADFYPFYLSEHRHPISRRLHFLGISLVIACVLAAFFTGDAWWLMGTPVAGYLFAWIGHFVFEGNRPASFEHPLYSFIGDWMMFKDTLVGRIRL